MDEFARHPKGGRRVEELAAFAKPLGNGVAGGAFIETSKPVLRGDQARKQRWMKRIGCFVSHYKDEAFR